MVQYTNNGRSEEQQQYEFNWVSFKYYYSIDIIVEEFIGISSCVGIYHKEKRKYTTGKDIYGKLIYMHYYACEYEQEHMFVTTFVDEYI